MCKIFVETWISLRASLYNIFLRGIKIIKFTVSFEFHSPTFSLVWELGWNKTERAN